MFTRPALTPETRRAWLRAWASILYDRAPGEYRIFNDRLYPRGTECGIWIVRDGMSREVHRDTRGTRLETGDEIHIGRAVILFEIG